MKHATKFRDPSASAFTLFGLWVLGLIGGKSDGIKRKSQNVVTVMGYRAWLERNFGKKLHQRVQRESVWETLLEKFQSKSIAVLEFGVAHGYATNWWMQKLNRSADVEWHGFDRFTGLPANWRSLEKGHFDAGGHAPDLNDERVIFYKGNIEDTLPKFVFERKANQLLLLFFDFDLFEPTEFAWNYMKTHLQVGDFLYFDEAFDEDERKILDEYVLADQSLTFKYVGSSVQCLLLEVVTN
jgi:hypothetical protein